MTEQGIEAPRKYEGVVDSITMVLDSMSGGRNIALLINMGDGWLHTCGEIDQQYQEAAKEKPGVKLSSRGFANAQVRNSMDGVITCVDEGDGTRRNPATYSLTTFAKEQCLPRALKVARLCYEADFSPLALVGNRTTARTDHGLEAPFVRLGIYATLLDTDSGEPIAISDFIARSGLDQRVVHNHLPELYKSGVLVGSSDGSKKRMSDYLVESGLGDIDISTLEEYMAEHHWSERKRKLLRWVYEQYGQAPNGYKISVRDAFKEIEANRKTEDFFRSKQRFKQNEAIQQVLDVFVTNGALKVEDDASRERITHIQLTNSGREILTKYLMVIAETVTDSPDSPQITQAIVRETVHNLKFMNWLLRVDYDKGFATQQESGDEKRDRAMALLSKGALTTSAIMEATGWKRRATHNTLKSLVLSGTVTQTQDGRESIWSINPSEITE